MARGGPGALSIQAARLGTKYMTGLWLLGRGSPAAWGSSTPAQGIGEVGMRPCAPCPPGLLLSPPARAATLPPQLSLRAVVPDHLLRAFLGAQHCPQCPESVFTASSLSVSCHHTPSWPGAPRGRAPSLSRRPAHGAGTGHGSLRKLSWIARGVLVPKACRWPWSSRTSPRYSVLP